MSNLSKRYIYAVVRNLPESQREEVSRELHATIEDMVADHTKSNKPTEVDYEAVLQKIGDPDRLANSYTTSNRYLIGPCYYDAYLKLLKMLLSIVPGIVVAVMLMVGFAEGGRSIMATIINAIGTGIMVGIHIAFWVTLVFVILERIGIQPGQFKGKGEWTPAQLPQVPKNSKRQISIAESVAGVVLIAIGMIWVALSPLFNVKDGEPLINPDLWSFWMPVFFVLAGLSLLQELIQVRLGNWTTKLMVSNVFLSAASILFFVTLVTTQQVVNPAFIDAWGWRSENYNEAMQWTSSIILVILVGAYIWGAVQSVILNRRFVRTLHK